LHVKANPTAAAGSDVVVCAKISQNLGAKGSSALLYSWYPTTYLDDPSSSGPLLVAKNNGVSQKEMEYILTVSDGTCSAMDSVRVALFPNINSEVSQNALTCKNEKVRLEARGGIHYLWDDGDTTATTMVDLKSSGYVHVRIENVCVAYDSVLVRVMNDESVGGLYIPNAFTPNDDGINDYFEVKGQYIASLKALIFDRWGAEIHQWEGASGSWDGRMNGHLVQNDVYVYRIFASTECGDKEIYTGIVTVIK
jgi:gliding motility-associated-like protein